jgi:mono/diheme cytochrome c family protein
MSTKQTRPVALALLGLVLASCGGADSTSKTKATPTKAPAATTPTGAKEARVLFDSLCFTCHGATGRGDGPGAAALDPKPRSFSDAAWQDSVTDEHITKVIVYGGAAVGKSPMMPAQPQLKGQTETLAALVKIVREFRGK